MSTGIKRSRASVCHFARGFTCLERIIAGSCRQISCTRRSPSKPRKPSLIPSFLAESFATLARFFRWHGFFCVYQHPVQFYRLLCM